MTYKARLEELLSYSILKSNAYIDIVSKEGQSNSSRCIKAEAEWEVAENAYIDFLLKFEGSGASINDQLPASMIIPGGVYQNMIGN